jgi:hypothetical protein
MAMRNPVLTGLQAATIRQRRIAELQDIISADDIYTRNARQLVANIASGRVSREMGNHVRTAMKAEALRRAGIPLREARQVIKAV